MQSSEPELRQLLELLASTLDDIGEHDSSAMIRCALGASDEEFRVFLASNELWGGMGSIADQAGCDQGRPVRRRVEERLIGLGKSQMRHGIVNVRTRSWIETFSNWQRAGI